MAWFFRENLQESPIFHGKIDGFRCRFSRKNQSIEDLCRRNGGHFCGCSGFASSTPISCAGFFDKKHVDTKSSWFYHHGENSSLPTLLSPNRFSMFFDASTYFSRLAICQASSYGYGLLVSETTWSSARSPRGFFPARLSDLPHLPIEVPGSEPFTCPHPPQWKAENRPLQPRCQNAGRNPVWVKS